MMETYSPLWPVEVSGLSDLLVRDSYYAVAEWQIPAGQSKALVNSL